MKDDKKEPPVQEFHCARCMCMVKPSWKWCPECGKRLNQKGAKNDKRIVGIK